MGTDFFFFLTDFIRRGLEPKGAPSVASEKELDPGTVSPRRAAKPPPSPGAPRGGPAGGPGEAARGWPPARGGAWPGPRLRQAAAGPDRGRLPPALLSDPGSSGRRRLGFAVRGVGTGGEGGWTGRALTVASLFADSDSAPARRIPEMAKVRRANGRRGPSAGSPLPGRGRSRDTLVLSVSLLLLLTDLFSVCLKSTHPQAWGDAEGRGTGKSCEARVRHNFFFPPVSTNLAKFSVPSVYIVPGWRLLPLKEEGEKNVAVAVPRGGSGSVFRPQLSRF